MILSDRDIANRMYPGLGEKSIIIDPWPAKARMQPASVELTLAADIKVETCYSRVRNANGEVCVDLAEWWGGDLTAERTELHNTQFALACTVETVRIPDDLVGQVNGKSSLARRGLIVHTTAGFIDPGFHGQITLELKNVSNTPFHLRAGMAICQLVFMQMTSPALRPYGSEGLGSHYQGQEGPTPSAL